jgi:hypothetical protein
MALSSRDQQQLAQIEAELSADGRLVQLAGYVGKRAARWRWLGAAALLWFGLPLAVGATGGLITAAVLGVPVAIIVLAPVLALLWPLLGVFAVRRWRRPRPRLGAV